MLFPPAFSFCTSPFSTARTAWKYKYLHRFVLYSHQAPFAALVSISNPCRILPLPPFHSPYPFRCSLAVIPLFLHTHTHTHGQLNGTLTLMTNEAAPISPLSVYLPRLAAHVAGTRLGHTGDGSLGEHLVRRCCRR